MSLTIRKILENVQNGSIRIPAFQRGFVWDAERVAYLMDSIYKGYPFGSLILWRTKEKLAHERQLGPFELPEVEPDYPIDYVLDGQQRLTSIFGVFQTDIQPGMDAAWSKVYFDMGAEADLQESQFICPQADEVDLTQHFPIGTFFDVTAYRRATQALSESQAELVDKVQSVFKEATIPTQEVITEDRAKVAIVFERVNRLGVELDIFQLLSAWTWSEEFDLQDRIRALVDELAPHGFGGIDDDLNLLMRCCAAVVASDASVEALMNLRGQEVRERFDEIENGVKGAIDFLKNDLNVHRLANLPYQTLLVPLSVFFAAPTGKDVSLSHNQRKAIKAWFWRSCFSRRYSAGVLRNLKKDIDEMKLLKATGASALGTFPATADSEYFSGQTFTIGTVHTKTFILLLASNAPRSFVSNAPVNLEPVLQAYNREQFHHLMPKSYLKNSGFPNPDVNRLANFAIISANDNRVLAGDKPSVYVSRMSADAVPEILESALCPMSLLDDDYHSFIAERADRLAAYANTLLA